MRYIIFILIDFLLCCGFYNTASAQNDAPIHPSVIGKGVFLGISPPLRDLPALNAAEFAAMKERALIKAANKKNEPRLYPFAETALPKGPDAAWQKTMGESSGAKAPIVNFEGQTTTSYPPDCNGTIGPNHYMQTVNVTYSIYNRTGTLLAGPTALNTLFTGVTGATNNDGDPIVLYDEQADRWLVAEFTFGHSNDYMLVAVSTSNDPTGTWYKYSFDVTNQPDYPKFGVWQDGYYMGINSTSGNDTYVFERSKMLLGQTAQMVGFDNSWRPGTGFLCVPPLDNDGVAAPAGSPGMFIAFNDDAVSGGSDELWLYELAVNWVTPASSTFIRSQQLAVTPFDSQFTASWDDITQPTSQKLDGVPQVIMNAPQYRNFGTYQTIVCCHTVDVDATNHAGIRWYELRKTSPATTWTVRQQSTYAPDVHSRWMGSIMLNGSGKIGVGYSISSSTIYPGIRYCGQSASAYASASSVLDLPEEIIHTGTVAQTSYNRWGDYALLSVDPADDQTFWFTTEYVKTGGSNKGSKIASFKFGNSPTVTTLNATSVTGTSAIINGSVNPNGLATTYYFEWGTSVSYGTTTTTTSAGSGTSTLAVNANLTSLTLGITYHFRLVATNSDGVSYGGDLSFTTGAASVTTTAATAIGQNTATAGGNVITDGGFPVSARGTCWSTASNPVITDSHTTDGAGLGVFTSSLNGLSASTTYHMRAYATNAGGTYYGADLTFTTLCGVINALPFTEGFESLASTPLCWSEENSNPAWQYITGNGNTHPSAAHTGVRNACLQDASAADNKNKLITPVLDFSSYIDIVLTFWHTQAVWASDQDQLSIFYRTSSAGTWVLLQTYTANVTAWTQRTITLPNTGSYYQIAFEGNAKYGYGVCIDDISITGTSSGPMLTVLPANQNVPATPAGSTTFAVTSNSAWTVVSDQTWCTVNPSGTGNGTIIATYTSNTLPTSRLATITTTVAGIPAVLVTVTQSGFIPALSVLPSNQDVPATPAGSATYAVTSNSSWTVVSDQSWCTVNPSGTGDGTIIANYTANTSLSPRVANITATVAGIPAVIVTLTQSGVTPTLTVLPSNQNVPATPAGSTTFAVTSNSSWTVVSNQSWCTVNSSGTGDGTITADFTVNTSPSPRVANITTTVTGIPEVIVTVTQSGATPTLTVLPANQNVPATPAGSTSFAVTSNSSWTVVSDQSWCTVTSSGNGDGTIDAVYQENPGMNIRSATVTVTVNGISPVAVTVTQDALVGMPEKIASNIMLFPNPNTGKFTISTADHKHVTMDIKVVTIDGKIILVTTCSGKNSYTFDLSDQPKGDYLVRINTTEGNAFRKVIVE
ncbi:MAG: BACON domain-containing protein [Bacteroidales bacterium]